MKTILHLNKRLLGLIGLCAIGLLIFATPAANAEEQPNGMVDNSGDRITYTTGSLTAVFEGMGPRVTFYDHNAMMSRTIQQVNFRALIEFSDNNHDSIYQSNETVAFVALDSARWTHTSFYSLPDHSGVGINFTQADPLMFSDGHSILPAGSVILIVKAYNTTKTMTVNNQQVSIKSSELKFDIVIQGFPFHNTTNMLALQVNLHSASEHYDLEEHDGTQTVDGSHEEAVNTPEHQFSQTSNVDQETRFSTGSITTSTSVGFFRFVNTATVTTPTGQTSNVPVTASYKAASENDDGAQMNFMKLYLAYPNFGSNTLVHDPSIGLSNTMPTLYIIAGGAAIAALAAVVVIRRRHVRIVQNGKN